MKFSCFIIALFLGIAALPAAAEVRVFACEPEWAALAEEIGGELVRAESATTALQDPHKIQARPSLIADMRRADLLICSGADLEVGWLPVLLTRGNNPRVQPGRPGHLIAADHVQMKDVPTVVDRAMGDIHPQGNPHLHLDPHNLTLIAGVIKDRLGIIDPDNAARYEGRHTRFVQRWQAAIEAWEQQAAPLDNVPVVVKHNSWVYLFDWLGIDQIATLEPKPGIPPSAGYLAKVLARLKQRPARMILRAAYQDDRSARWLAQRSGLPVVVLPYTVGAEGAGDLFALFETSITRMLVAMK